MGVDDDVDVFWSDSCGGKIGKQLGGLAVELDHPLGELVAHAGFDEHVLLAGADKERVQPRLHVVSFVGHDFARPHDFGNHAEERAAV